MIADTGNPDNALYNPSGRGGGGSTVISAGDIMGGVAAVVLDQAARDEADCMIVMGKIRSCERHETDVSLCGDANCLRAMTEFEARSGTG